MAFDPSHPSPIADLPDTGWPTINQLAAIGSVVAAWSYLDLAIQALLARLVQSDDMLSQALVEDLSPDNRLKALRRLVNTWKKVAPLPDELTATLDDVLAITKWIAKNKEKRNHVAHWIWSRSDDEEMFGWKHHQAPATGDEHPSSYMTKTEMLDFSVEIGQIAARVTAAEAIARALPPWPPSPSPETRLSPILASLLGPHTRRG